MTEPLVVDEQVPIPLDKEMPEEEIVAFLDRLGPREGAPPGPTVSPTKSGELTAGGPGSGRYPKGSGAKNQPRIPGIRTPAQNVDPRVRVNASIAPTPEGHNPTDEEVLAAYDAILDKYGDENIWQGHPRGNVSTAGLLDAAGYNEPPTVLSQEDFALAEGQFIDYELSGPRDTFWRGAHSERTYTNLAEGAPDEHRIGFGIYGNGTYMGDEQDAMAFSGNAPYGHTNRDPILNALNIQIKIKQDAKVVDWFDIPEDVRWDAGSEGNRVETWAVENGVDVINTSTMDDSLAGINVLNRGALIVEKLEYSPAEAEAREATIRKAQQALRDMD